MRSTEHPPETGEPGGGAGGAPGGALLPDGFRFGVATAGFQIEGGYNGPGEPRNNWFRWEREGRVEPSGVAIGFWDRYEEQLDLVAGMGCNSFRLSVEWTRAEPEEGSIDAAALDHYRRILAACRDRGLTPLVTLHHFTHPAWLGEDFWLQPDSPERFAGWVERAVDALGDSCTDWVTINECNILTVLSYLTGTFPPGRVGKLRAAVTGLDHMVAGHVLAYDAIHRHQPEASVATNNFSLSIYELDRLPLDVLVARHHGVDREKLGSWLGDRRADHYRQTPWPGGPRRGLESALRSLAARAVPLDGGLPRAVDAVFSSENDRHLDVAQLDYYVPAAAGHFGWPGRRTAGGRALSPAGDLWDDRPDPAGLVRAIREAHVPGLDVWVVENGLCNRVRRGRSYPRLDGWTRDRYLRENLSAVVDALDQGVPVSGYWHWTLADNYEWGSYEPRFGLFGVDRERGVRVGPHDAMGVDAAGAYRVLIDGLRAGDRAVLRP
jgi:beta-glucosidase/6-phospho-beta-glucosidase/beta-galactosidase